MEVLVNRFAKITGSLLKAIAYAYHTFFPKKRFEIPFYDPAKKQGKQLRIPKVIWQTNYTNRVTLPVYINFLFIRLLSKDWDYRYVSTEERLEYFKQHAPKELLEAYMQLTDGASQADMWRLFVLYNEGGVYMDIDAHPVWPLSKMIDENDEAVFLKNKEHYTNYFIASSKHHPIIKEILDLTLKNIQHKRIGRGVYDLTGPAVMNKVIGEREVKSRYYRETCIQGSFTNEYFQYIDKPKGKWTYKKKEELLKQ